VPKKVEPVGLQEIVGRTLAFPVHWMTPGVLFRAKRIVANAPGPTDG